MTARDTPSPCPPSVALKIFNAIFTAVVVLLTLITAAALLYSAFCQYSWLRMTFNDYGIYTNFIWNSGHGDLFRYLLDRSYLSTHLSFTLLLLGPLFRIWDDAFLLTLVQWLCGMAGLLIIWRIMAKYKIPLHLRAAIGLCFAGYPYAQYVLLCEFHGVCTYLVLLPWLYYCLAFRKSFAWLPLALILGLREEAALVAIPLVLYFAVADRWRAGYLYAALALAYCIVAVWFLFPSLSGITLAERRGALVSQERISHSLLRISGLWSRAQAIFLLFLPAIPFLRRGFKPIIVFPLLALLILQFSPTFYHHALQRHYPAAVFPLMMLGIVYAEARTRWAGAGRRSPAGDTMIALYLVIVTVITHLMYGALPLGIRTSEYYTYPHPESFQARMAVRQIPRDGVLITAPTMAAYTSNRRDIIIQKYLRGRDNLVDFAFFPTDYLFGPECENWLARIRSGEFGVTYFDYYYVIAARGAPGALNGELFQAAERKRQTIVFSGTEAHRGTNRFVRGLGICRFWHGNGSKAPADLSHGASIMLEPGSYIARFRCAADTPARDVRGNWGFLSVHLLGAGEPLGEAEIAHESAQPRRFRTQDVRFELTSAARVEPRVTAGDATLYLDRVIFLPAPGNS